MARVFKPKDEEPYGRLNPKVWQSADLDCYSFILRADNEMATPAISVAYTIWSIVSHS
jgi:hypothetical protein